MPRPCGPGECYECTGREHLSERRTTGLSNAEEETYGHVKVCISFIRLGIISLITSLYTVPPGMSPQDVPFLLETRTPIEELGGTYSCAGPGEVTVLHTPLRERGTDECIVIHTQASVVVDGSVKTGQNPASESGQGLATEIYRALSAST